MKVQHEEQAQLAKADQELEREWVRTKAANQKARAQYLRLQREAKQEATKVAGEAARKQQEVTARIEQGKHRIEQLVGVESQLLTELSSTQQMKRDVVQSLAKMRNKRAIETGGSLLTNPDRIYLDAESREILAQFDLEYKALKTSVVTGTPAPDAALGSQSGLTRVAASPAKARVATVVTEERELSASHGDDSVKRVATPASTPSRHEDN